MVPRRRRRDTQRFHSSAVFKEYEAESTVERKRLCSSFRYSQILRERP